MSIHQLAQAFTELCAAGKFDEAGARYWSDDVISREPMGDGAVAEGLAAVQAKGARWAQSNTIHSVKVEGPFVSGAQFAVRFTMDITPKDQARLTLDEVGLYTVKDGKISAESFFYGA